MTNPLLASMLYEDDDCCPHCGHINFNLAASGGPWEPETLAEKRHVSRATATIAYCPEMGEDNPHNQKASEDLRRMTEDETFLPGSWDSWTSKTGKYAKDYVNIGIDENSG